MPLNVTSQTIYRRKRGWRVCLFEPLKRHDNHHTSIGMWTWLLVASLGVVVVKDLCSQPCTRCHLFSTNATACIVPPSFSPQHSLAYISPLAFASTHNTCTHDRRHHHRTSSPRLLPLHQTCSPCKTWPALPRSRRSTSSRKFSIACIARASRRRRPSSSVRRQRARGREGGREERRGGEESTCTVCACLLTCQSM